ncbi:hypothetical protein [Bilophila wadsworthia]|uniref:hypothetical protein n=1 Tax=Bilophila wadsworthia TaxID=35833 RepID=UPI003C6C0B2D
MEQKGGPQSRDHLLALVQPGQNVEVIPMSVDQYSRTVALIATDRVLNADMLEAGRHGPTRSIARRRSVRAGKSWSGKPRPPGSACGAGRTPPRRGNGGRSENEESPGCFDPRALFYWLGGVMPGAGFTASMSSCGTSSNMR